MFRWEDTYKTNKVSVLRGLMIDATFILVGIGLYRYFFGG